MLTIGAQVDKQHVQATVVFAIKNVPHVDPATLIKFLELVQISGSFGSISEQQLLQKIGLLHKYVPCVCGRSLLALVELLGLSLPAASYPSPTNNLTEESCF